MGLCFAVFTLSTQTALAAKIATDFSPAPHYKLTETLHDAFYKCPPFLVT